MFKYDPSTGFSQIGPKPFQTAQHYVRGLAYDSIKNVIYAGIGTEAYLKRYDITNDRMDNILPSQYDDEVLIGNVQLIDGKIFALLSASRTYAVLSETLDGSGNPIITVEDEIPNVNSNLVSPEYDGKIYYTTDGVLYYYDLDLETYGPVLDSEDEQINLRSNPTAFAFVELDDQVNYPGTTLVATYANDGQVKLFKYNLDGVAHNMVVQTIDMTGLPTDLRTIGSGLDGKIYTTGYMSGSVSPYTSMRSDLNDQYFGITQIEGMTALGDKMYFGAYGDANIFEYDPSVAWDSNVYTGDNPKHLFSLAPTYEQDRPFAMLGAAGKLFIGTIPGYGELGGALSIYDPVTESSPTVLRDIVVDQSVIALTYHDGIVYGGTSIWGGLGNVLTQTEGKLFGYNVSTGLKTFEITPVAGKRAVTAVMTAADGKIWGLAEGYLFIYNPITETIEYSANKFPDVDYTSAVFIWTDAKMFIGKDDNIWGSINGKLFKIDPSTKAVTIMQTGYTTGTVQDNIGDIYYMNGSNLWRYSY